MKLFCLSFQKNKTKSCQPNWNLKPTQNHVLYLTRPALIKVFETYLNKNYEFNWNLKSRRDKICMSQEAHCDTKKQQLSQTFVSALFSLISSPFPTTNIKDSEEKSSTQINLWLQCFPLSFSSRKLDLMQIPNTGIWTFEACYQLVRDLNKNNVHFQNLIESSL